MIKHTPGPWKWGDDYRGLYGQGEVRQREVLTFEPYEGMWLSYTDHQDANARLIAAAPLMYEALEEVSDAFDDGEVDSHIIKIVRAALQAAKGGDSVG